MAIEFVFFGVSQIIRKKAKPRSIALSAKKSYFNNIFSKAMSFYENEIISVRFFLLASFVFTLLAYHVVSLMASEELLLKKISLHASVLIFRAETPVLANEVSVLLCRITGFTKNDFWQLKMGVIFTLTPSRPNECSGHL